MAWSELGDSTKARQHLSNALRIDPNELDSLIALAKAAFHERDYAGAEPCARKALATETQDVHALDCLGAALFYKQRSAEAFHHFEAAIAPAPELPTPYCSLAYLQYQRGKYAEGEATLRTMFAKARKRDIRDEPVFRQARAVYRAVQASLAESQAPEANREVEEFRALVERHTGRPYGWRRPVRAPVPQAGRFYKIAPSLVNSKSNSNNSFYTIT